MGELRKGKPGKHFTKVRKLVKVCSVCNSKFRAADVKAKVCRRCKTKRHHCRCGCGQFVVGYNKSYLFGHAARHMDNPRIRLGHKQQGNKIRGNKNPSRKLKTREKLSISVTNSWAVPEIRLRHFLAHTRVIVTTSVPNKLERFFAKFLNKRFPSTFKLNVRNGISIGGKVPDFVTVVRSDRVLVELFGDYWHGSSMTGHSRWSEECLRRAYFRRYGYRTCVVWQSQLESRLDSVVSRLNSYLQEAHRAR